MACDDDWAPAACTLPTAERPLRVAEFDDFFASVKRFERPHLTRLKLVLPREAEATGRDLAQRESQCCSFFTFTFEPAGDELILHIAVPPEQVAVLDAIDTKVRKCQATPR